MHLQTDREERGGFTLGDVHGHQGSHERSRCAPQLCARCALAAILKALRFLSPSRPVSTRRRHPVRAQKHRYQVTWVANHTPRPRASQRQGQERMVYKLPLGGNPTESHHFDRSASVGKSRFVRNSGRPKGQRSSIARRGATQLVHATL